MKIIPNFFSEELIKEILSDRESATDYTWKDGQWKNSSNYWDSQLTEGLLGLINILKINSKLEDKILEIIQPHVPACKVYGVMHYFWHPLSGINFHNDAGHVFGATIYLNEKWNINHGGLLLIHNQREIKAYPPSYNTCIINTKNLGHAVTMTSAIAPIRHTIQIFGTNET